MPNAPVAQLDRVPVSETGGHRFDSCQARQFIHRLFLFFASFNFAKYILANQNLTAASSMHKHLKMILFVACHIIALISLNLMSKFYDNKHPTKKYT